MKKLALAPPISTAPDTSETPPDGLAMPGSFTRKAQRTAWEDLIEASDTALHTKENRFTFEMAAVLLAKFRSGKAMNACEAKQLQKNMVALGLVKDDDGESKTKSKTAAKYFGA